MSVDDVLAALSNVQRRELLDSLLADSPPDGATNGVAVDVDVSMHHVHLPKLVDYGLVEWDEETDRVTRGANFEDAAEILELLDENADVPPTVEATL
ncbi:hypothetical protein G9C83_00010 [Halobacterium sp. R2-5]|nr:hypothetical protein [Halobacterium sp. R2-5]NIB97999.1 hypothetical protein [Halobacterium sp. R2-5]